MELIKAALLLSILFSIKIYSQFSLDRFITDPLDKTLVSVKDSLAGRLTEINFRNNLTGIKYYDWIAPVSIRVLFLFNKDGREVSKGISNAKNSKKDVQILFNIIFKELTNKFGGYMTKNSLFGVTRYSWLGVNGDLIALMCEPDRAKLTIITFK